MLKESLIENNSILLNQKVTNWKEAIKLGTDLLIKAGTIEPRYYDSVLITLAGSDSDKHMEGLMEITQTLDDEESDTGVNLDKVLACKTPEDVYAMIDAALNA